MLKRKVHIYAWILIFVLVIAGCSKESKEENEPPEKSGLAKVEFYEGKITYNGKKYIQDPRLSVPHKKWIGKGVGLIYDSSVVYEIKDLPDDQWLMGSFEHDSLVFRAQSLGRFDLTNFLPNRVEVLHQDNSNPADPKLIPGKTTMNRKIIDKIIETVTQQQPMVLDPLKPVKTEKYLDLKSNRYPMLEYHLTYKVDESGTIYLEEREEMMGEAKAYRLTFDNPQEKADWESFLSQDNIPEQPLADPYDPNSDINTQISPGLTEKPQYTGPRYLADFQTTDEELWRISHLAYMDNITNDFESNIKEAAKMDDPELLEALKELKVGASNSKWEFLQSNSDPRTGYQGIAIRNREAKEIVIGHRGTEDFRDVIADAGLVMNIRNLQFDSAQIFTNMINKRYGKSYKIIHTGHSLGGAIGQKMAMKNNQAAVVYNGAGLGLHQPQNTKESAIAVGTEYPIFTMMKRTYKSSLSLISKVLPKSWYKAIFDANVPEDEISKNYSKQIRNYTIKGDMVSEFGVKPNYTQYELNGKQVHSGYRIIDDKSIVETINDNFIHLLKLIPSTAETHPIANFEDFFKEKGNQNLAPRK